MFLWRSGLKSTALEITAPLSASIIHDDPLFGFKLRHKATAEQSHQLLYIRGDLCTGTLTTTVYNVGFFTEQDELYLFCTLFNATSALCNQIFFVSSLLS